MAEAKIFIETPRLLMREIVPGDAEAMFEMESDPAVHRYLGTKPVQSIDEVLHRGINFIRQQYITNGIGRWAVIDKATSAFVGWSGLKLDTTLTNSHVNFYDLGYRFMQKHWGKGYATETAKAAVAYGFDNMGLDAIYGRADAGNIASQSVLQKAGLQYVNTFDFDGVNHKWYEATKQI